jgi:rhodanese-related sulfurtransferase
VDAEELDDLLGWSQLAGERALSRELGAFRRVLRKVPLENMRHAFERMTEREAVAGETIVAQGEPGEHYYVLVAGAAEVWRTDPFTDETACVAVLHEGDGFGEEALLQEGSRNATVKMIAPGRLLVLSKEHFDGLLKPAMLEEVEAQPAHDMLRAGAARLLDCRYLMEYEEGRIPGATLIPLDQLREGVFTLDPEPMYIVYCRSGRRSKAASYLLRERGIRSLSLRGGIRDWPYAVDTAPLPASSD